MTNLIVLILNLVIYVVMFTNCEGTYIFCYCRFVKYINFSSLMTPHALKKSASTQFR